VPACGMDGLVEYDAKILIEFSEAIHPATLDLGGTIEVVNLDVVDHLGRPIPIPGTLTPSLDGRLWTFTPSFHYGTGPWDIQVLLTTGIEDRAGNALVKPVALVFRTRENPDVDTVHSLLEEFDTNHQEDMAATTAEWNTTTGGELTGGAITTNVVTIAYSPIQGTSNKILTDFPLGSATVKTACPTAWANGCRVMMSYTASDIGVAGAITEVYWGPASNALFAATHDNVKIRIGHGRNANGALSKKFDGNWAGGQAPAPAYDGVYKIPQDADVNIAPGTLTAVANHWAYPKLTTPFEYDGQSALLLDIAVDAAADCQTHRVWFHGTGPAGPGWPGIRLLVGDSKTATENFNVDANYPDGYPMVPDTALVIRRRKTEARSRFYDSAQPSPDWAEPILSPSVQPGGATFTLEWQGAPGMPHPTLPYMTVADESQATHWSTDIDVADGHRFVRFRVKFVANLNSETVPHFRRISMPFSFGKE
ncbi:MAG: Ig-like domain-containing protein, partial [Planctomycetota bacterium]